MNKFRSKQNLNQKKMKMMTMKRRKMKRKFKQNQQLLLSHKLQVETNMEEI